PGLVSGIPAEQRRDGGVDVRKRFDHGGARKRPSPRRTIGGEVQGEVWRALLDGDRAAVKPLSVSIHMAQHNACRFSVPYGTKFRTAPEKSREVHPATAAISATTDGRRAGPRERLSPPGFLLQGRARSPQIFLELPLAAAACLSAHDQVEARHKSDELAAGTGLVTGIRGDAFAAATAFARVARG